MNNKKRGLNRGLDALLAGTGLINQATGMVNLDPKSNHISKSNYYQTIQSRDQQDHSAATIDPLSNLNTLNHLKIQQLTPGQFQPRKSIQPEELEQLVGSIKKQGVLQPLIVRSLSNDLYEIIAGERRWRAATIAGYDEVPVIIKNVNDQDALTIALIENIQRANLNPLEEAIALDRLTKEFSLTHNEVATAVGKSRTAITNLVRILQLPNEIKQMLEKQQLDLGHAKVLLGAPKNLQIPIAHKIANQNLSVRATEALLKKYQSSVIDPSESNHQNEVKIEYKSGGSKQAKNIEDPDVYKLQRQLSDFLGTKVMIEPTMKTKDKSKTYAKGNLIIAYNSLEELEGILEHFEIN